LQAVRLSWVPTTRDDEESDPLFEASYDGFLTGAPNLEGSDSSG
jgi:hypothetical protein